MIYFQIFFSFLIFIAANIYVGKKGWLLINTVIPKISIYLYWAMFIFIALSFITARISKDKVPHFFEKFLNILGGYWLSAFLYFIILLGVIDIVKLILGIKRFSFIGAKVLQKIYLVSNVGAIIIVAVLLIYGTYNATNIKTTKYALKINKDAGQLKKLNIVMLSDLHLGDIVDKQRLSKMVIKINELNADIVILAGDIVDDYIEPFIDQDMGIEFQKIHSKYGVFAVFGNHEYYGGSIDKIAYEYENSAGFNLLRDKTVKIEDSFYIVGREDLSYERYSKTKRKKMDELLKDTDKLLPIIVIDHQPVNFSEGETAGVDLQFSGHTHNGQLLPANIVTKRLFENDFGLLTKGNYNVVVSSGVGTWGPPIRIGTSSEIVQVELEFK
ncbi:metallophosphoesterase [Clostridium bowmanii]|uniref:metallophosphoesterase n=1 Tax=Clostridium bowmanii TaxID=132925 RepID=UPI001C0C8FA2|nr:metallophosphoesterase [Clostridium bowmanii]MBU3190390.1 metallophosphoesterase [Clostridium bowmanii]MCA1074902.1 metallophosphoesterase [Clostridium bowmanii]